MNTIPSDLNLEKKIGSLTIDNLSSNLNWPISNLDDINVKNAPHCQENLASLSIDLTDAKLNRLIIQSLLGKLDDLESNGFDLLKISNIRDYICNLLMIRPLLKNEMIAHEDNSFFIVNDKGKFVNYDHYPRFSLESHKRKQCNIVSSLLENNESQQKQNEQVQDYFIIDRPLFTNEDMSEATNKQNLSQSEQNKNVTQDIDNLIPKDTDFSEITNQELQPTNNCVNRQIEKVSNLTVLEVSQQIELENLKKTNDIPETNIEQEEVVVSESQQKDKPEVSASNNTEETPKQHKQNFYHELDEILEIDDIISSAPDVSKLCGSSTLEKDNKSSHKENKVEIPMQATTKNDKAPNTSFKNMCENFRKYYQSQNYDNKINNKSKNINIEKDCDKKTIDNIADSEKTIIDVETPQKTPVKLKTAQPFIFKPNNIQNIKKDNSKNKNSHLRKRSLDWIEPDILDENVQKKLKMIEQNQVDLTSFDEEDFSIEHDFCNNAFINDGVKDENVILKNIALDNFSSEYSDSTSFSQSDEFEKASEKSSVTTEKDIEIQPADDIELTKNLSKKDTVQLEKRNKPSSKLADKSSVECLDVESPYVDNKKERKQNYYSTSYHSNKKMFQDYLEKKGAAINLTESENTGEISDLDKLEKNRMRHLGLENTNFLNGMSGLSSINGEKDTFTKKTDDIIYQKEIQNFLLQNLKQFVKSHQFSEPLFTIERSMSNSVEVDEKSIDSEVYEETLVEKKILGNKSSIKSFSFMGSMLGKCNIYPKNQEDFEIKDITNNNSKLGSKKASVNEISSSHKTTTNNDINSNRLKSNNDTDLLIPSNAKDYITTESVSKSLSRESVCIENNKKDLKKTKRNLRSRSKKDHLNLRLGTKLKKSGKVSEKSHSCKDFNSRNIASRKKEIEKTNLQADKSKSIKDILNENKNIKGTVSENRLTKKSKSLNDPRLQKKLLNEKNNKQKDKKSTARDDHLDKLNEELRNETNSKNYDLNRILLSKRDFYQMNEEDIKNEINKKAEYSGLFAFDESLKNNFKSNNPFQPNEINSEQESSEDFDLDAQKQGMDSVSSNKEATKKDKKVKESGRSLAQNRLKRNYGFRSLGVTKQPNSYWDGGFENMNLDDTEYWLNLEKEFGHILHDYTMKTGEIHQAKVPLERKKSIGSKIDIYNNFSDIDYKLDLIVKQRNLKHYLVHDPYEHIEPELNTKNFGF